ncbi:MAG: isocitrate/isopropylmalate family dehydrogenase, partial [Candidatus Bathyarchaeia archaeon]
MTQPAGRPIKVCVISGDGVGPEVIKATLPVLDAVQDVVKGLELHYVFAEAGLHCIPKYGTNLPEETIEI